MLNHNLQQDLRMFLFCFFKFSEALSKTVNLSDVKLKPADKYTSLNCSKVVPADKAISIFITPESGLSFVCTANTKIN